MKFPDHKAGLMLMHNEHRGYYESADEWMKDNEEIYEWPSDDAKKKAIETDSIWTLTWYPATPVGSYSIAAPTLEELLQFAETTR